jgi:hypothetical protein
MRGIQGDEALMDSEGADQGSRALNRLEGNGKDRHTGEEGDEQQYLSLTIALVLEEANTRAGRRLYTAVHVRRACHRRRAGRSRVLLHARAGREAEKAKKRLEWSSLLPA